MTTNTWSANYDADAEKYTRSDVLTNAIGTRKQPDSWSDPALASLFARASPSSTSISSPTPQPDNKGAIIGGAVGGVVAVLLLAGILAFCLIRRRKRKRATNKRKAELPSEIQDKRTAMADYLANQSSLWSWRCPSRCGRWKGEVRCKSLMVALVPDVMSRNMCRLELDATGTRKCDVI